MANNCTINIKADKLPIVLKKVEYYMFRAVDRAGISYLDLATSPLDVKLQLLSTARELLEDDLLKYSKKAAKLGEDTDEGKAYLEFATNLQGINANWDEATAYFTKYFGGLVNLKSKFKLDEAGLIDLDETADEDGALLTKFVFDQPANEVDPVDNIDKGIELFLRSIKREGIYDDYGFNVLVDYGSFVRRLSTDLEDTLTISEIVNRLETLQETTPEYKAILEKLKFNPTDNASDLQFKINFRNSFAKALIPIYITSFENGIVKVIEATIAKKNLYQEIINANFFRRGMPVKVNGKTTNLAHQENNIWILTKDDLPKITRFMDAKSIPAGEGTERRIQFLEALGFEFSPESREKLKTVKNINSITDFIYNQVVNVLNSGQKIKSPIEAISKTVYVKGIKKNGQRGNLNTIIDFELKYNRSFNIERSIVNSEGNRQHAIQNHNNFTVVNKFLSDPVNYPTLQSIVAAEPALAWIDPTTNPAIGNSLYLNSLFFYSPNDPNFGARRRVTDTPQGPRFSATQGQYVLLDVVNTGGVQIKDERGLKTDSASSTSLESGDKLIQDINLFTSRGFTSVQRLSDKSTDLAVSLNYYVDPVTGYPVKRILGGVGEYTNIFDTEQFIESSVSALKDVMKVKYLASKGFYEGLTESQKATAQEGNFGVFTDMLGKDSKDILNILIKSTATSVEDIDNMLVEPDIREVIFADIKDHMMEYAQRFKQILQPITSLVPTANLLGVNEKGKARDLDETINFYLANTFLSDIENLKVFFGDAIFFKAFHKRSSKDSATGIFTTVEDAILEKLNDYGDAQGYGANTNLGSRMLAERLYNQGLINQDERDQAIARQTLEKGFRSAVIKDVEFKSTNAELIAKNIERLRAQGYISDANYKMYKDSIEKVISENYKGVEADGQGKCTFDFYRIMSILTSNWSDKHEQVYRKITMYAHYQELAESEQDEAKRGEYITLRDSVGYDPLEDVYFPPKKFQYAGPMEYIRPIDGNMYTQMIPVFDKFSLQPLIPTIIKGTADEQLAKRMQYNGVGYVKFESGSKVETPSDKDDYYVQFKSSDPANRKMFTFEQLVSDQKHRFNSEQTLFFNHLKEQVRIDAEIHEDVIFGSQVRKLLLTNILGLDTDFNREEFLGLYNKYTSLINSLIRIEKRELYAKMGIKEAADRQLSVSNVTKLVQYFFTQIDKKNQDSNVRRALKYDESTGKFEIPLDGAVQAQVIEGIVISAINNRIVRYHANGSMLTQVAITGSERIKFDKEKSKEALETFGNTELKYYNIVEENGKLVTSAMQVKIGLTGKWKALLNLKHPDGQTIGSLERLNEALKDDSWKKQNRDSIRMGGYRIPTQGPNFIEVMEVAEFLPSAFGDAIILPSEIVIKSGSDFDIDKLFVFYPNLVEEGENAGQAVKGGGKPGIENELYKTMFDIILHPANYMQLVTPSTNYHIMPLVDKIYKAVYNAPRKQTDYKNTQLVDRDYNMRKFLSLLKGKNDLGIAAVANTFNVLFQLSNAKASSEFLANNKLRTFFSIPGMEKTIENMMTDITYGDVYDEDGVYKSEFFSEFINAFVDVAKDDYVFAVNVVTELSPIMFYMKFMGMSSEKIFAFVNQPAIRTYIKNLSKYENITVKSYLEVEKEKTIRDIRATAATGGGEAQQIKLRTLNERLTRLKYSSRKKALAETLRQLGFGDTRPTRASMLETLTNKGTRKPTAYNKFYTSDILMTLIKPDGFDISTLSGDMRLVQMSMLHELESLRVQSNSMTEAQRFLNFDTKPYASVFDVYLRNHKYVKSQDGGNILSERTIDTIKNLTPISPLNVGREIVSLLESLFPVRNDRKLNTIILSAASAARENFNIQSVTSEDDMQTFARTFRNDFMSYILYNYLDKSAVGKEFFQKELGTDKSFAEYMKELVGTPKLLDEFNKLKALPREDYQQLLKQYPFVQNIVPKPGDNNPNIISFKLVENSSHPVDKESVIAQFEEIINLPGEENKDIRQFFRDLALYATFQSGYNYGEFSYIAVTPQLLINKLYGEAVNEFNKLTADDKTKAYGEFEYLFRMNNPIYYEDTRSTDTPTKEQSKRGKWYAEQLTLEFGKSTVKSGNVLIDAGVKPSDMAGNAAKDITMAGESTQFIGFKSGNAEVSSTDKYRLAWKDKANTGNYTESDVIMVSASGTFRGVTREQIIETFETKYVPLLDKAIGANVSFRVGNRYEKGNLGDFLVANYLRNKGYSEQKFDGYSKWSKSKVDTTDVFALADQLPPIEQNFADSPSRRMRPEFAGKSTMDLIISGDRTRTTRSKTEMARYLKDYNVAKLSDLVGKVIRMTDKNGRMVYTKITKVSQFTQEYQDKTWMKEGWVKEVTDRLVGQYPYALEFEVIKRPASAVEPAQPTSNLESKINTWIANELPWNIETPASELAKTYEQEKLTGETIEEFLHRMSCLGKLK